MCYRQKCILRHYFLQTWYQIADKRQIDQKRLCFRLNQWYSWMLNGIIQLSTRTPYQHNEWKSKQAHTKIITAEKSHSPHWMCYFAICMELVEFRPFLFPHWVIHIYWKCECVPVNGRRRSITHGVRVRQMDLNLNHLRMLCRMQCAHLGQTTQTRQLSPLLLRSLARILLMRKEKEQDRHRRRKRKKFDHFLLSILVFILSTIVNVDIDSNCVM